MMNMAGNAQRWFMDACKRGDFKQAMKLLPEVGGLQCVEDNYALRNTFVNSSSEDWQWTTFHYAAKYGELEFIRDFFNLFSSSLANALTKRIIPRRTRTRAGLTLTGETIFLHPMSVSGYKDLRFGPRLKESQLKDGKGRTPLHIACGHGHLRILYFYIDVVKCDLQCRDNLGRTPFHYASEQGHVRIVQCLIEDGLCEPNCCDSNQQTPLQIAYDVGQTAIHVVDYMTDSESGMCEYMNSNGDLETSTNAACDRFDSSKVPLLPAYAANTLENRALAIIGPKGLKERTLPQSCGCSIDVNGRTKLHIACGKGYIEVVKALLSSCAHHINMQDNNGRTALHFACSSLFGACKRKDIVAHLLATKECDPSITDNKGRNALHIACDVGDPELVSTLLIHSNMDMNAQDENGKTPLHYVLECKMSQKTCQDIVRILLAYEQCNLNVVDINGYTPLEVALYKQNFNRVEMLQFLTKPASNVNEYTMQLHLACARGDCDVVHTILSNDKFRFRAALQSRDVITALHISCASSEAASSSSHKWKTIIRELLAHPHCQISATDNYGRNALHIACIHDNPDIISLLLSIDQTVINVQDRKCKTPLHYASMHSNTSIQLLLDCETCDTTLVDDDGNTPLQMALSIKNSRKVKIHLLSGKCNPNTNINGYTPLHFACEEGDLELVSLILSDREYRSDMKCSDGKTPLHSVCSSKKVTFSMRPKIIRKLLAHRPSLVSAIDNTGCTALHFAVTTGDSETTSLLLSTEASLINVQDNHGLTPLHYACLNTRGNNEEVVKLLLAYNECDKDGNTVLQMALSRQNHRAVRLLLLSSKCNVNTNIDGYTPLHFVCEEGDLELVSLILSDREYRSDMKCSDGKTPLHSACSSKKVTFSMRLKIVKMLLAHRPSLVSAMDNTGCTALHFAVTTGDYETTSLLLSTEASLINVQDNHGRTPLHYACLNTRGNNEEVVKLLLAYNECDPNVVDKYGNTVLQTALSRQNHRAVKLLLLSSKCNPNTNINGYTPLHLVCEKGDLELVSLILSDRKYRSDMQCSDGKTPLHSVCSSKKVTFSMRPKIIRKLLAHRPSLVSAIDNTGCTALHFTVTTGDYETTSLLLSTEASLINVQDDQGHTPLHYACLNTRGNNEEVVKLLLAYNKCDPNVVDKDGNTVLQTALSRQNHRAVKLLLLSSKCNPNTNINGYTPLHFACEEGDLELVSLILSDREYRSDMQCSDGKTPLHSVCSSKKVTFSMRPKIIRKLLAHRPSLVSAIDNTGCTALHFAVTTGDSETTSLLLSTEASLINVQDNHGRTPLHYACLNTRGNIEKFVKLLLAYNECDPNVVDKYRNTPLQIVLSRQNHRAVKQFLLNSKCNPNKNINGYTPLHLVCEKGDLELVSLILSDREYRSDMQCSDGKTPLHSVCSSKEVYFSMRPKIIRKLLAHRPSLVSAIDNTGCTALHFAVTTGDYETTSLLLSTKASLINVQDDQGHTPLHYACLNTRGNIEEFVKLLLAYSECDPNVVDKYRNTPLQIVLSRQNHRAVKQFLLNSKCNPNTNINGYTPLHLVCEEGDLELVSLILSDREYRSDMKCSDGKTPLHSVCSSKEVYFPKRLKIIRKLLAHRPSLVSAIDNTGCTALHFAVTTGDYETTSLLLSTEASLINVLDSQGQTPLHYACLKARWNNEEVVKLLLSYDACDLNIVDKDGNTPFKISLVCHNYDAARLLMENNKCDLGIGFRLLNPLHYACVKNDTLMVSILLSSGKFQVNAQDPVYGKTALHYACNATEIKEEIVKALTAERECDISIADNSGETALQIALKRELYKIIRILLLISQKSISNVVNNTIQGSSILYVACDNSDHEMIECLVSVENCLLNVQDETGMTPLHIACKHNDIRAVRILLSNEKCDTTVLDKYGKSAVEYTNDYDILRELFRHGANPSSLYHRYVLNRRKIPTSFVKVFVLGDSGVGKTTLVESLQREYLALVRAFIKNQKISEVELKTAGIVPTDFKSKDYGRVTLFDFAGQKQYFGTHEAFLNNAVGNCPPIFILVIDVSANQALDEKLLYWITFLKSTCSHLSVKPHIIIICSHIDVLKDANEDPLARFSVIEQVMTSPAFSWCHFAGIVGMDCRLPNSSDMLTLRQIMKRSCDTLRIKSRMDFNCHCFFVYLLDKFRKSLAITIDMVQTAIQTEPEASKSGEGHLSFIPDTVSRLCQICDKLDDHGHIIFIKDSTQLEMSWIIIDKASLFNKVTGAIFAPEGFKENFNLSTSTGVVPFSKMKGKFFPEYDIEMLMCFLSHMEFCNEVTDRKLLKLLTEGQSISATDRYFFFPSLVTVDAPSDVWSSDTQCEFRFGWCLKCWDADFFTPRFLQVLILRLAFIYALASDTQDSGTDNLPLPVIHRKCQVWKNGIFWGTKEGIECLVSVDEDNKTLLLLMKSTTINQACLKYRSTLLTKIMCIKEDLMCGLKAKKYVIDPKDSQYPLPPVNAISLDEINEAIIECNEAVVTSTGKIFTVDYLLVFEPYAKLGKEILKQLFCSQNQNLKISDEFLLRLASQWVERKMMIMKVFNPDPILLSGKIREMDIPGPASEILCTLQLWRDIDGDNEGTYKCLREKLDQFSICCGVNPLVSVFISTDHIHISGSLKVCMLRQDKALFCVLGIYGTGK